MRMRSCANGDPYVVFCTRIAEFTQLLLFVLPGMHALTLLCLDLRVTFSVEPCTVRFYIEYAAYSSYKCWVFFGQWSFSLEVAVFWMF